MTSIVHVISSLGLGGAETSLLRLLEGSVRIREASRLVSLQPAGEMRPRIEALGVEVVDLGLRPPVPWPHRAAKAVMQLRGLRARVLQGWMYHGNLAATVARSAEATVVWNIRHSLDHLASDLPITRFLIRGGARLSLGVNRVVYNSRTAAAQHESIGYCSARTLVIPNGFDLERFSPHGEARHRFRREADVGDEAVLVGVVGRFHPAKGHTMFLKACRAVAEKFPRLRPVLIGTGVNHSNEALTEALEKIGLGERVILCGPQEDMSAVYPGLDVLCSSSRTESFSNVIGEAMSAGLPCVVTDVGDSAWVVGETGIPVPPTAAGLTEGLTRVLAMTPGERRALGAAARNRIRDHFSLGSTISAYERLYDEFGAL